MALPSSDDRLLDGVLTLVLLKMLPVTLRADTDYDDCAWRLCQSMSDSAADYVTDGVADDSVTGVDGVARAADLADDSHGVDAVAVDLANHVAEAVAVNLSNHFTHAVAVAPCPQLPWWWHSSSAGRRSTRRGCSSSPFPITALTSSMPS